LFLPVCKLDLFGQCNHWAAAYIQLPSIVANDYQAMSSKLKLKWACQGQLKPDAEINHVPKLTYVECAELDTFMQSDNSNVTQI
jgi:hypothetical protein